MKHNQKQQSHNPKLFEGLRSGDLQDMIAPVFTIDQFKSKMGKDQDVVVIAFKAKEKMPAIDLMEFIEKGYKFVLDADMSTGEERDGRYSVFVELERTSNVPNQILELLSGIGQLTNCEDWDFRYFKDENLYEATIENLTDHIPLDNENYSSSMLATRTNKVSEFFNQGPIQIKLDENNIITFNRPFSGNVDATLIDIGDYEKIKNKTLGKISLDETSQSQTLFLNKFLGNYEITKIENKFLIRNGEQALVIEKNRW